MLYVDYVHTVVYRVDLNSKYSGTPLSRHPSMVDTCDMTDYHNPCVHVKKHQKYMGTKNRASGNRGIGKLEQKAELES